MYLFSFYTNYSEVIKMYRLSNNAPLFSRSTFVNQKQYAPIHWHTKHELYYLINGKTKHLVGEKTFFLQKGNLIFIPKGTLHSTDSEECLNRERVLVSFKDNIIPEHFEDFIAELSRENFIYISSEHLPIIDDIFLRIEKEFNEGNPYSQELIEAYILELIAVICRFRKKGEKPKLDPKDQLLYDISKHIQKNYHSDLSLDTLSFQFGMSKNYLSSRYKTVFGIGINDYINFIRILHAEKLLKTTNHSISRIATECGYNDSNYFSTVFKKANGITPYKYRQTYKQ